MTKVRTLKKTGFSDFYQVYSAKGGKAVSNHLLKSSAQKRATQLAAKTGKSYIVWHSKPVAMMTTRK